MMHQTNVYFTDQQLKFLKKYAQLHNLSMAQVVRMAISEFEVNSRNKEIDKLWQKKSNSKTN